MLKRRLTEPFGKAGVLIGALALVFAMLGGAYAATGGGSGHDPVATASKKKHKKKHKKSDAALTHKQKKEVEKLAKKFAGTDGAPGTPGAQGPAGPVGPAGANGLAGAKGDKGDKGEKGDNGEPGEPGKSGKSVVAVEFTGAEGPCAEGGSSFHQESSATKTYACNGKNGSPWTAGGTLPSESTETGSWSIGYVAEGAVPSSSNFYVQAPISFTVPLASELDEGHVHYILPDGKELNAAVEEVDPVECENANHSGAASAANPEAKAGNLCVYATVQKEAESYSPDIFKSGLATSRAGLETGASRAGALVGIEVTGTGALAYGTWAVTAP